MAQTSSPTFALPGPTRMDHMPIGVARRNGERRRKRGQLSVFICQGQGTAMASGCATIGARNFASPSTARWAGALRGRLG
eukprot:6708214-Heterocapsa_arctica.AAC.1